MVHFETQRVLLAELQTDEVFNHLALKCQATQHASFVDTRGTKASWDKFQAQKKNQEGEAMS